MEQMVKIVGINYWQNIGFIEKQDLNLNDEIDQEVSQNLEKTASLSFFIKISINPHAPDRFTPSRARCAKKLRISADSSLTGNK